MYKRQTYDEESWDEEEFSDGEDPWDMLESLGIVEMEAWNEEDPLGIVEMEAWNDGNEEEPFAGLMSQVRDDCQPEKVLEERQEEKSRDGAPDYPAQWAEFHRRMEKHKEAIEENEEFVAEMRAKSGRVVSPAQLEDVHPGQPQPREYQASGKQ